MTISKPMLAATVHANELELVEWPMMASPKLDGIRVITHPSEGVVTRSFKPVPNWHIREALRGIIPNDWGLDGELFAVGEDGETPLSFNETQSAVMSRNGQPQFMYAVFDCFNFPEESFVKRFNAAQEYVKLMAHASIGLVAHKIVNSPEEFAEYAAYCIEKGYEGAMLRDPEGPYKNGRSTRKQQWLLKYKEWCDAEGTVIGFEERMHNANEDQKDNFGYAKRSSHKENMEPMGTLGALVLDTEWGELRVGTGFDDSLRQEIWGRNMIYMPLCRNGPKEWRVRGDRPLFIEGSKDLGRKVTFKYQPFGMQDKPRFPVFMGFRENE